MATGLLAAAAVTGLAVGCAEQASDPPVPPENTTPATASASPANPEHSVVSVEQEGLRGAGVVISTDGHILTLAGPAAEPDDQPVTVTFHDGESVTGQVVGLDPRSRLRVVQAEGAENPVPARFGDSGAVEVGDPVRQLAGPRAPAGDVGAGTVSATARLIGDVAMIESDAPAARGAGGAPLVTESGEVVGINAAGSDGDGPGTVSLALPSNLAARVGAELIATGTATYAVLGVSVDDAGDDAGAEVDAVVAGSPAQQAGLRTGDVITGIAQRPVAGAVDVVAAVQAAAVGDQVVVDYRRGGGAEQVTVTLEAAPQE